MADVVKMLCDPCKVQEKHVTATEWCPDCEEGLCPICSTHHRSSKATRRHNLVQISILSDLPQDLTSDEVCTDHDCLQIEYFCTSHDELCCRACLADKHKSCNDVAAVDQACKNAKVTLLLDAKNETNHIIETAELVKIKIELCYADINGRKQQVVKDISDAKNAAIKRLEETEKKLISEIDQTICQFDTESQVKKTALIDIKQIASEKLKQIEFIEKHGTDKQAFLLAQKFKTYLKETETAFPNINTESSVTLDFVKPSECNVSLGTITKKEESKHVVSYSPLKQKQAQSTVERAKPMTSFKQEYTFNTKLELANVRGMTTTEDGRLLLCNYKDKTYGGGIYIYQQTGQFIKQIPLDDPYDITYIKSNNQFAVTLPLSQSIQFICGKSLQCLKKVKLKNKEMKYGIAATDNHIYIGTKGKVIVMNIEDMSEETTVEVGDGNFINYIEAFNNDIYVSWDIGISTLDKNKQFMFPGGNAWKIAADKQGYLYVAACGKKSSYVQRFTPDLKPDIRIDIDGGKYIIYAMCFSKDFSKLFLANDGGCSIVVMSCK